MSIFSRLFSPSKTTNAVQPAAAPHLHLEVLEDRTLPSSAKVVPLAQGIDNQTAFHRLVDALAVATSPGDVVTIEPGVTADSGFVAVNNSGITIQSDPNTPGSILPVYNLTLSASSVTLSRLNLGAVMIDANFSNDAVVRSNVDTVTVLGGPNGAGNNVIDQDVISGSVVLTGSQTMPQAGNRVTNNTFNSFTPDTSNAVIAVTDNTGVTIQNNAINGQASGAQVGISITRGLNQVVGNNTIALNGADLTTEGIVIQNPGGGPLMTATVNNNSITTNRGVGLFLNAFSDVNLQVQVQGNDFHNNAVGVDYLGSGGAIVGSDLGGGSNSLGSSLGGNNFRGYPVVGSAASASIRVAGVSAMAVLHAQLNLFDNAATAPQTVFVNGPGSVDLTQTLNANRAFVQSLYDNLLGRTGTLAELDGWVAVLTANPKTGQADVVNGVLRSSASLTRIVDAYYLKYLGRTADSAGAAHWVALIQSGVSLESVQAGFISSAEFLSNNNSDYIQGLYRTFLNRTGTQSELAFWSGALQEVNGLTNTAVGFALSGENRAQFVQSVFASMLHRPATSGEQAFFVSQTGDLLALELQIMSTPEYFTRG